MPPGENRAQQVHVLQPRPLLRLLSKREVLQLFLKTSRKAVINLTTFQLQKRCEADIEKGNDVGSLPGSSTWKQMHSDGHVVHKTVLKPRQP